MLRVARYWRAHDGQSRAAGADLDECYERSQDADRAWDAASRAEELAWQEWKEAEWAHEDAEQARRDAEEDARREESERERQRAWKRESEQAMAQEEADWWAKRVERRLLTVSRVLDSYPKPSESMKPHDSRSEHPERESGLTFAL